MLQKKWNSVLECSRRKRVKCVTRYILLIQILSPVMYYSVSAAQLRKSGEDDKMEAADDSTFLECSSRTISNFLSAKSLFDQVKRHKTILLQSYCWGCCQWLKLDYFVETCVCRGIFKVFYCFYCILSEYYIFMFYSTHKCANTSLRKKMYVWMYYVCASIQLFLPICKLTWTVHFCGWRCSMARMSGTLTLTPSLSGCFDT